MRDGPQLLRGTGASVIGRAHVRVGRGSQDAWAVVTRGEVTVGVVTDGCSSQPHSEFGARFGARFLAGHVAAVLTTQPLTEGLAGAACDELAHALHQLLRLWDADPSTLVALAETHALFTLQCAVLHPEGALVFGLGDGACAVDGHLQRFDPGPENAPEYLGYRLTSNRRVEPRVHHFGPAQTVAVMTDGLEGGGVGGLLASLEDPLLWRNPVALQRKLNVMAATEKFDDDATLVALHRGA
jgi:hypothetical protein